MVNTPNLEPGLELGLELGLEFNRWTRDPNLGILIIETVT